MVLWPDGIRVSPLAVSIGHSQSPGSPDAALHFIHYNFARVYKTLRITPAPAGGLSDHAWGTKRSQRSRGKTNTATGPTRSTCH